MANRARGEVEIDIGGRPYVIAWSMGAQAEVEAAFDLEFAEDIFPLLFRQRDNGSVAVSARTARKFLAAVLRGCGHRLEEGELAMVAPGDFAQVAVEMFTSSGLRVGEVEGSEERPSDPAGSGGNTASAPGSDTSA